MFLVGKKQFLVFLVITLVVSIGPINAELIGDSVGGTVNSTSQSVVQDKTVLDDFIRQDMDDVDGGFDVLEQKMDYAKSRAEDYDWKVWKWQGITSDIIETFNNMTSSAKILKGHADKLAEDTSMLKTMTAGCEWVDTHDEIKDDACCMANNLSANLNTEFDVNEVSASELKEGDIVQYMSNGYPRYLKVVGINQDTKQKRSGELITPQILLKGTGTNIKLVDMDKYLKLTCKGDICSDNILTTATQIQKNDIQQTYNDGIKKQLEANELLLYTKKLGLSAIGLIFFGVLMIPLSDGFSASLCVIGILLGIIDTHVFVAWINDNDMARMLNNQANEETLDLDYYTCTEEQNEPLIMDISTFEDIPILKQPPIADWKECTFILVKKPEHGTLLPGPGIQFLYGPDEGYTGKDNFVFQYLQNGAVLGTVKVNITVNATPVLTIPKEE